MLNPQKYKKEMAELNSKLDALVKRVEVLEKQKVVTKKTIKKVGK